MPKRLQVSLLPEWADYSHTNPDGGPTFYRRGSEPDNPLQLSWAWYRGGKEPRPTDEALIRLSSRTFDRVDGFELRETAAGPCAIGRFGTAVARAAGLPRLQSWHLSNGLDFLMVTHVCGTEPTAAEVAEAQQIVAALVIAEEE
jgi:hypothetical protein